MELAGARLLDGWAGDGPVGAKDTAVTRFRLQQRAAAATVIEELTGVHRHPLGRLVSATRAGDDGMLDHGITLEG